MAAARIICSRGRWCFDRLSRVPRWQNGKQREHCRRLPCIANTDLNTYTEFSPLGNEPEAPELLLTSPRVIRYSFHERLGGLPFYFVPYFPTKHGHRTFRFVSFNPFTDFDLTVEQSSGQEAKRGRLVIFITSPSVLKVFVQTPGLRAR